MYKYEEQKQKIFTEKGQEVFIKIRDNVQKLLKQSGAFMMQNAIVGYSSEAWLGLACVDRMVELNELREISQPDAAGQHRVFISRTL